MAQQQRTLELTLISAKGLKDVSMFSKMEVYAVASLDGEHRSQQRTAADRDGGRDPTWNATLRFPLSPSSGNGVLHVILRADRALGDRDVGEVHVPIKDLLSNSTNSQQFVSYQVRRPNSGKSKGVLNISYKIIDSSANAYAPAMTANNKVSDVNSPYPPPSFNQVNAPYPTPAATKVDAPYPTPAATKVNEAYPPPANKPEKTPKNDDPVTAYPAPPAGYPAASSSTPYQPPPPHAGYPGYPPPPQQYGYGYGAPPPPQYGYGYPPAAGYGYGAAPPPQPPKKNKFGMGLGAGLLGGALGGLLIGDMVSDAADYDAGYDDGGGFDF